MKKIVLLILLASLMQLTHAQTAYYSGTIGTYKIRMELNTDDGITYTGRYRYASKDQWIALEGKTKGLVLYLKEFVDGKVTGLMDLVFEDVKANGHWRKNDQAKPLSIQLSYDEAMQEEQGKPTVEYYYAETMPDFPDNELKVQYISDDQIEANIFIANNENCAEFYLKGRLSKSGDSYKGVMVYDGPEENLGDLDPRADVVVILDHGIASVTVDTHFGSGNGCLCDLNRYVKKTPKEDRNLK